MKVTKTPLPAERQIILGCQYDSTAQHVKTAPNKRRKYLRRIQNLLEKSSSTVEMILQLHGNLNYAALVAPFGKPFLAPLTACTRGHKDQDIVPVTKLITGVFRKKPQGGGAFFRLFGLRLAEKKAPPHVLSFAII